jgi:hypothetical protein
MPAPTVDKEGVSSQLLVYRYRKLTPKDHNGNQREFSVATIQYNPRTSGKGFYRVLKKRRARIKGSIANCRIQCGARIVELLTAKRGGVPNSPGGIELRPAGNVDALGGDPARAGNVV